MVRNILLASLISTFCYFGALGAKDTKTELICLGIAFAVWFLCIWRCVVLNRRNAEKRQAQGLFNEHMRRYMRTSRYR